MNSSVKFQPTSATYHQIAHTRKQKYFLLKNPKGWNSPLKNIRKILFLKFGHHNLTIGGDSSFNLIGVIHQ
jgi:hypothetical protein